MGDDVASLEQKATLRIEKNGTSDLAVSESDHEGSNNVVTLSGLDR